MATSGHTEGEGPCETCLFATLAVFSGVVSVVSVVWAFRALATL